MSECPMCKASDCGELRSHPLDPCPVYWAMREALFPAAAEIPDDAAHALFWLAVQLGQVALPERRLLTSEVVELFTASRLETSRAARGEEIH